jgi:CO dehydrogenase maturation factor
MDNEAGMEHLSRRTTDRVDVLLLVSNHSVKGVRTLARIWELVTELKLTVGRQLMIVNLAPPELDPLVSEELSKLGIEPAALIPEDELIYRYDLELKPLLNLPDTSIAVRAVNNLMTEILRKNPIMNKGAKK